MRDFFENVRYQFTNFFWPNIINDERHIVHTVTSVFNSLANTINNAVDEIEDTVGNIADHLNFNSCLNTLGDIEEAIDDVFDN